MKINRTLFYQGSKIELKHLPINLLVKDKEILKEIGTSFPPFQKVE